MLTQSADDGQRRRVGLAPRVGHAECRGRCQGRPERQPLFAQHPRTTDDPDDLEPLPSERDGLSHDRRVGAVAGAPHPIRQHHQPGCVAGLQRTPQRCPRPEQREIVVADEQPGHWSTVPHHDRDSSRGEAGEVGRGVASGLEVGQAELVAPDGTGIPTQRHQRVGVGQIDWPQDVRIDERERRGQHAETETDRRRDSGGVQRRAADAPQRVTDVLQQDVEHGHLGLFGA